MKIDTGLLVHDLDQMPGIARAADDLGFDGLWTFETANDPFLPLVLAAEHSQRLAIGTSIAVAFVPGEEDDAWRKTVAGFKGRQA
jgi:alkanesulfonate monooxygenase SsuD/methylene tetrahydromethanopterin reductase-like flavin-dependent oxidoreductase (luciferase family)